MELRHKKLYEKRAEEIYNKAREELLDIIDHWRRIHSRGYNRSTESEALSTLWRIINSSKITQSDKKITKEAKEVYKSYTTIHNIFSRSLPSGT